MIDAFTFYVDSDDVRSAHCKVQPLQTAFCNFLDGDVPVAVGDEELDYGGTQIADLGGEMTATDGIEMGLAAAGQRAKELFHWICSFRWQVCSGGLYYILSRISNVSFAAAGEQ